MTNDERGSGSKVPAWRRYLRFWRPDLEGDLDQELRFHLDERVEALLARGVPRDVAESQARAELGDDASLRSGLRAIDGRIAEQRRAADWRADLMADLRHALRGIRRSPTFAAAVIVTLALGIGATTAVVSIIDATLLRPLPFPDAGQLMVIHGFSSFRGLDKLQADHRVFANIGSYGIGSLNLSGGAEGERVKVSQVTPNVFGMLGISPIVGNTFVEADGGPTGRDVAILGYGLWQRQFGGDPSVVGRRILLNQRPFTVVGVMPAHFAFPGSSDLWIPLVSPMSASRSEMFKVLIETEGLARLAPGATARAANATVCTFIARTDRQPIPNCETLGIVAPLRADLVGDRRPAMLILAGVVAMLLLITCINVSTMLLARSPSRRRELAVRAAIGASRARLVRKLLVESATLAIAGGIAGFALAEAGVRLFAGIVPTGVADISPVQLDHRVLLVTMAISLAVGPLFGVIPALVATRGDLHDSLRSTVSSSGFGPVRQLGRLLVAIEIAASLILTVGAGLLVKSLIHVWATDSGVTTAKLVTGRVSLARVTYRAEARPFFQAVLARLEHDPDVQSAGLVSALPLRGDRSVRFSFDIPGAPPARRDERFAEQIEASAGYFETMGIQLVAGRTFSDEDRSDSPPVAIVSQTLASANWPGESALGKQVAGFSDDTGHRTIVGVVRDIKAESLETTGHMQLYIPFDQGPSREATIIVRGTAPPGVLATRIRAAVQLADPQQIVFDLETMDAVVSNALLSRRTNVMILSAFGAIAVLLSAVGIYALLAFGVAQRTREIGIRMALGARQGSVVRLVVRDGTMAALIGVAVGIAGALALTRVLRTLLYDVSPLDPLTFVLATAAVLGVVALASFLPARAATQVDPLIAIRME